MSSQETTGRVPFSLITKDIQPPPHLMINRTLKHKYDVAENKTEEVVIHSSSLVTRDINFPREERQPRPRPNFHDVRDIVGVVREKWESRRHTNPLDPQYQLASSAPVRPPTPPKFVYDGFDNRDICGNGSTLASRWERTAARSLVRECEGSTSKPQTRSRQRMDVSKGLFTDTLHVQDISGVKTEVFRTKRQTNPLSPEYTVGSCTSLIDSWRLGSTIQIGDIQGAKPTPPRKPRSENNRFGNLASDIVGNHKEDLEKRRAKAQPYWSKTLHHDEAHSKTIGQRGTDPLSPQYLLPGHTIKNPEHVYREPENAPLTRGKLRDHGDDNEDHADIITWGPTVPLDQRKFTSALDEARKWDDPALLKFNTLYQSAPPQRVETALSEPNMPKSLEKLISSTKDFLTRSSTSHSPATAKPMKLNTLSSYTEKRASLEKAADVAAVQALP